MQCNPLAAAADNLLGQTKLNISDTIVLSCPALCLSVVRVGVHQNGQTWKKRISYFTLRTRQQTKTIRYIEYLERKKGRLSVCLNELAATDTMAKKLHSGGHFYKCH